MRSLTVAILLLAPALPAAGEDKVLRVPGDRAWTHTGIQVRLRDRIEIDAGGSIDWGKGAVGPEGTLGGGIFRPINTEPSGGLIARVGTEMFFVGARASVQSPGDGELLLGINDDKVEDNSGAFRVELRVRRDGRKWEDAVRADDREIGHGHGHGHEPGRRAVPDARRETFWWRGRVDGTDRLVLRGRSLEVRHIAKLPIQEQDHEFSAPLPRNDTLLELRIVEGRGRVRLLEEPSAGNDYSAVVLLDDADERGAADYEIELSWERPRRAARRPDGSFHWRGRVDIGCTISIRGEKSWYRDAGGRGTEQLEASFADPLPARDVAVSLEKRKGRGEVVLVESPSRHNGYTAVVEIEDSKGGTNVYDFELTWEE